MMRELESLLWSEWTSFQREWDRCREVWRDEVGAHFERTFIDPWKGPMEGILRAAKRLEEVLLSAEMHIGAR